jgi:hypothetical protein
MELTAGVLCRDPASALATFCRTIPAPGMARKDVYYIDRDFWLFRHIVNYLRHDTLPSELETLKELYREASYYKLSSLQRAIEQLPVGRISRPRGAY